MGETTVVATRFGLDPLDVPSQCGEEHHQLECGDQCMREGGQDILYLHEKILEEVKVCPEKGEEVPDEVFN